MVRQGTEGGWRERVQREGGEGVEREKVEREGGERGW